MTDSNRVQVVTVRETTFGTTPTTPRMRAMKLTGEGLRYAPRFVNSAALRADRMEYDPIKVNEENAGPLNLELHYPANDGPLSDLLRSAFYSTWNVTAERDNDGTADSVITDVATTNTVVTCATGTAFVAKELVRFTGFGVAGNNGVFACTTGSATVPRFVGSGITNESAPAAAARMKVVGFIGDSGDINATSTGLSSTTTDFTTFPGLVVGKWLKIGGTAVGTKFTTAALNDWVRISAISATALTFDNRPSGWTTETGTGLTVKFWYGDYIRNGTARTSLSIERGFLGQATPTYILQKGMIAGQLDLSFQTEQVITAVATMMGLSGSQSTTAQDASPDAAPTSASMAANVSVGRIAESGSPAASPSWVRSLTVSLNNNLRPKTAVGTVGNVDIGVGSVAVTGRTEAYFGDNALLTKLLAGTVGSINLRTAIDSQAMVVTLPRVTFSGGAPSAGGKNQDVMLPLEFIGSADSTTSCVMQMDRLEYYE